MDKNKLEQALPEVEATELTGRETKPASESAPVKGAKERFYDKLPVTKRMMDIICAVLIFATVIALIIGIYLGNG